jgi:S1-C subfamily serine protease
MSPAVRVAAICILYLALGFVGADAADDPAAAKSPFASLGLTLDGLTVAKVEPESKAARAGLQPGDIIAIVGAAEIKTPAAAEAAVSKAINERWSAVPIRAKRNGELLYFYVY